MFMAIIVLEGCADGPWGSIPIPGRPEPHSKSRLKPESLGSVMYALTRNSTSGVELKVHWEVGGGEMHLLAHGSRLGSRPLSGHASAANIPTRVRTADPVLRRAARHAFPAGVVGAGILLIALSPGVGWALIVFGGWLAALALQGRTRRKSGAEAERPAPAQRTSPRVRRERTADRPRRRRSSTVARPRPSGRASVRGARTGSAM